MRPCAICGREDRGFGYVHELRPDLYPSYRFCSMRCLDAGAVVARRNNGMIECAKRAPGAKTDMERMLLVQEQMDAIQKSLVSTDYVRYTDCPVLRLLGGVGEVRTA